MKHAIVLLCVACAACSKNPTDEVRPAAPTSSAKAFVSIPDEWSDAERARFYHLSEGSAIFPLAWLESLEVETTAASGAKMMVPALTRVEQLGAIPDAAGPGNPYALPVGFTTTTLGKIRWAGVNCAACHVGEMTFTGSHLRLDGGPNMTVPLFDVMAMLKQGLDDTLASPSRAAPFVDRVRTWSKAHPEAADANARSTLDDFRLLRAGLESAGQFKNLAATVGTPGGYGRIDAFGFARNVLFGAHAANRRTIDAPVSTPDIWDMQHTAWLHWGANTNSVIERNLGQALATGVNYDPKTYDSTIDLSAAYELEALGYKLSRPQWPEAILGPIDRTKADRGRALYQQTCAACHDTPLRTTPTGLKVYRLFAPSEVGTDPAVAVNFDKPVLIDGKRVPFPDAAEGVLRKIKAQYYQRNKIPAATQAVWEARDVRSGAEWDPTIRATLLNEARYDDTRGGKVYPAKPLAGIWATAPYLHNGSVPTVYHLLLPREKRPVKFRVGQREFDPVRLGYQLDGSASASDFELDSALPGNSNAGHEYGTAWSDEQRFDVIEYLKTLGAPPPR